MQILEDRWLIWKLKQGNSDALGRIYHKYKNELLALALALSHDKSSVEDVVHDVFVAFAQAASKLQLRTSLKSYLLTSVANRVHSIGRAKVQVEIPLDTVEIAQPDCNQPDKLTISLEEFQMVTSALAQLPYPQREVIVMHLHSGLKFRQIADSQGATINTIQSRYRNGLNKLRSLLNGQVKK